MQQDSCDTETGTVPTATALVSTTENNGKIGSINTTATVNAAGKAVCFHHNEVQRTRTLEEEFDDDYEMSSTTENMMNGIRQGGPDEPVII